MVIKALSPVPLFPCQPTYGLVPLWAPAVAPAVGGALLSFIAAVHAARANSISLTLAQSVLSFYRLPKYLSELTWLFY